MERAGRYRVVETSPTALRLEKPDRVPVAHAISVLLLLAFIGAAPFLESPAYLATLVPGLGLMITGLFRISRIGSRGSLTRIARSLAVETTPGEGYRDARARCLVVDGRRLPAERLALRFRTVSQSGAAPDINNLYLVGRDEAFLVDGSFDRAALERLAQRIADALGIPPPPAGSPTEPISSAARFGVLGFMAAELAASAGLVGVIMTGIAGPAQVPVGRVALAVLGRLAVHALLVFGTAAVLAGDERRRAAAMFAEARST